jgi:Spy/CpxP family protein refolding chaperone
MSNWKNAALVAVLSLSALPVYAQTPDAPPPPPRAPGAPRAPRAPFADRAPDMHRPVGGVEAALRMRSELKLSSAQVNQLEALRKEIVAQRQNEARDMIDLRSRAEAGNLDREEARKQLEARRDALRETMKQRHEQFDKILTQEQRTELRHLQRDQMDRAHMRDQRRPRGADRDRGRGFREPPQTRNRYRW